MSWERYATSSHLDDKNDGITEELISQIIKSRPDLSENESVCKCEHNFRSQNSDVTTNPPIATLVDRRQACLSPRERDRSTIEKAWAIHEQAFEVRPANFGHMF